MVEKDLGTAWVEPVALDATGKPLKREYLEKIRLNAVERSEVNKLQDKLGFGERARVWRYLLHNHKQIEVVERKSMLLKQRAEIERELLEQT